MAAPFGRGGVGDMSYLEKFKLKRNATWRCGEPKVGGSSQIFLREDITIAQSYFNLIFFRKGGVGYSWHPWVILVKSHPDRQKAMHNSPKVHTHRWVQKYCEINSLWSNPQGPANPQERDILTHFSYDLSYSTPKLSDMTKLAACQNFKKEKSNLA